MSQKVEKNTYGDVKKHEASFITTELEGEFDAVKSQRPFHLRFWLNQIFRETPDSLLLFVFTLIQSIMSTKELEEKIEGGAKFKISLEKRTLHVNGKKVCLDKIDDVQFSFDTLEDLYDRYKHSLPGERDMNIRKRYFIALPEEELSDDDMFFGERRQIAQFRLEFYLLCAILSGALKWDESWGTWFWQSEKDKSLVLLRQWIEPIS